MKIINILPKIKINKRTRGYVNSFSYLGCRIDNKLRFDKLVENQRKAQNHLATLKSICGIKFIILSSIFKLKIDYI